MSQNGNRGKYYIIPWALSAAFLIRAMFLRDQASTYTTKDLSIWQSPAFYFVLSGLGFVLGLYFLTLKGKGSDSD